MDLQQCFSFHQSKLVLRSIAEIRGRDSCLCHQEFVEEKQEKKIINKQIESEGQACIWVRGWWKNRMQVFQWCCLRLLKKGKSILISKELLWVGGVTLKKRIDSFFSSWSQITIVWSLKKRQMDFFFSVFAIFYGVEWLLVVLINANEWMNKWFKNCLNYIWKRQRTESRLFHRRRKIGGFWKKEKILFTKYYSLAIWKTEYPEKERLHSASDWIRW